MKLINTYADFCPSLRAFCNFYGIFVLTPHIYVSTIIAKEKETIAILLIVIIIKVIIINKKL